MRQQQEIWTSGKPDDQKITEFEFGVFTIKRALTVLAFLWEREGIFDGALDLRDYRGR
jgi:hypothetical protein